MNAPPRVRPSTPADDVFMYASMIKDIPRDLPTEAIGVFLGNGPDRIVHAIDLWKKGPYDYLFFSGLGIEKDRSGRPLSVPLLLQPPYNLPEDMMENVIASEYSANTATDAEWLAVQLKKHMILAVTLTTSGHHMTRSYLTLIKALQRHKWPAIIVPSSTAVNAAGSKGTAHLAENHSGEFDRIIEYQQRENSDLCSREEFLEYMQFLHTFL